MRDLGQQLGLRFTIEDSWGGDLTTAAVAHLAATHDARRAADGVLHERLDARPHRGLPAAQQHGRGRAPERARPRHRRRRRALTTADDCRATRCVSPRAAKTLKRRPPRLAGVQRAHGRATLLGGRAVEHQHAVEVVELVLEHARVPPVGLDPQRLPWAS